MFCSHVRYVCLYVCMYICMYVCTKSFLKTTTNSSCVCTHLANKADSDSDFHTILALRHYQYSTILQEIFNRNIIKQLLYYILLLKPQLF